MRSRKFAGESAIAGAELSVARALHLLGALIQYLINLILSQSRDLAYSRGRAASILRAVAKGKRGRQYLATAVNSHRLGIVE